MYYFNLKKWNRAKLVVHDFKPVMKELLSGPVIGRNFRKAFQEDCGLA